MACYQGNLSLQCFLPIYEEKMIAITFPEYAVVGKDNKLHFQVLELTY